MSLRLHFCRNHLQHRRPHHAGASSSTSATMFLSCSFRLLMVNSCPTFLASSTSFRRFQYSRESFAAISRVCRCFSDSLSPAVEKLKHSANKSGDGGGKNADLQKKSVYLGIGHDYEFYWMRGAFSLVNMSPRATTL